MEEEESKHLQTKLDALKNESDSLLVEEEKLKIAFQEIILKKLQEEKIAEQDRERRQQQRQARQERRKEIFGDEISNSNQQPTTEQSIEPRCEPLHHNFVAHPTKDIIFCTKCGKIENV